MSPARPMSTRAGFWLRAAALSVDAVIVLVFTGVAYFTLLIAVEDRTDSARDAWRWGLLVQLAPWLLYGLSEVLFAATPGKKLLGQSIGTQAGAPASRWRLFDRWSTKNFPFLVVVLYAAVPHPALQILSGGMRTVVLLGCLAALNDDRLAWHDEWSGTAVWRRLDEPRDSTWVPAAPVPVTTPGATTGKTPNGA